MHDTSETVALGRGGRDNDGEINAMMDEEDMERRRSSSSSSSSSSGGSSKSHDEDEDAGGPFDVVVECQRYEQKHRSFALFNVGFEVLEAVRSINEGRATFKEAQTRFEMFCKSRESIDENFHVGCLCEFKRGRRTGNDLM